MFLKFQIILIFLGLYKTQGKSLIENQNVTVINKLIDLLDPFVDFVNELKYKKIMITTEDDADQELKEEMLDDIKESLREGRLRNVNGTKACSVSLRNLKQLKMPLFIKPGTTLFYPYDENGVIQLDANDEIELVCMEGFETPYQPYLTTTTAFCVSGLTFKILNQNINLDTVSCTTWHEAVVNTISNYCSGGTKYLDVGFQLAPMRFASIYKVCFNERYEVTRYVEFTLAKGANSYQNTMRPGRFLKAGYFDGEELDTIYTKQTQKVVVDRILGLDSSKYFNNNDYYLVKGHLAAKADFVYGSQQRATFLYINTAPQWQSFNRANWLAIENGLRKWVDTNKLDLLIWAGVYGVTSLTDIVMTDAELFLVEDKNNEYHLPVPKLFFRVAIEPISKRGIVLIGVNNPHLPINVIEKKYVICPDVADKITYLNYKRFDLRNGYCYACEVNEFRKVVTHLPTFDVRSLLV